MKKIIISKLFLYRHRFVISYVILTLAFVALLFGLPLIAQDGLSNAEMESATSSYHLAMDAPINGDLTDLPYKVLQKVSIRIFGLTPYAIKLPSILLGLILGMLFILLLNRWFKNNVSLLASSLVVLSTPFLFLAGSGTPLIMLVFWPTLLLWLGSKIQGEKRPKPMYSFLFAISMALAIFTPFMLYFALFCVIFVAVQPHLRFVVRSLPKLPLTITGLIILAGIAAIVINAINQPTNIQELLGIKGFDFGNFFPNIVGGLRPVFQWFGETDSIYLAPLIGLPVLSLALTGLFSTTKGFFASRNSIASVLIVFGIVITGLSPEAAIFLILPLSILVAHGLKYLLEKWYGLFPENPYARLSALLPLTILFGIIILPSLLQYIYGYHYNSKVASQFDYSLEIIHKNLTDEVLVVRDNYDFYKILEDSMGLEVVHELETSTNSSVAVLKNQISSESYQLSRIITSPMKENSDIIYLYTKKGEENGPNN
ncbi:glycosyltransferase family 39 protein [Candidatus Saccharibacteria bacterium]|nr:glycosyltransferase family 39 protein [Candidatus Saccharibacteria bacterium]